MEDQDIINLWETQNARIEQSIAINKQLLTEVITQKAQGELRSLRTLKSWGIVAFVIYLLILGNILFFAISHYSSYLNYFIISIGAIFIINIKGMADYIRHLVMVDNISYEGSLTTIQEKLSLLQLSILKHGRLMFLQTPFWTTFYLSSKWFPQSMGWGYMVFQIALTGIFVYVTYWIYTNLTIANANKKWVKILIGNSGGRAVGKALNFYKETEEFKLEKSI